MTALGAPDWLDTRYDSPFFALFVSCDRPERGTVLSNTQRRRRGCGVCCTEYSQPVLRGIMQEREPRQAAGAWVCRGEEAICTPKNL